VVANDRYATAGSLLQSDAIQTGASNSLGEQESDKTTSNLSDTARSTVVPQCRVGKKLIPADSKVCSSFV